MFTGEEETVTLEFRDHLAGAVIDRFGRDVSMVPCGAGRFRIHTAVAVSPQFFGWLCGFGDSVRVIAPEGVAARMREHVAAIYALYHD